MPGQGRASPTRAFLVFFIKPIVLDPRYGLGVGATMSVDVASQLAQVSGSRSLVLATQALGERASRKRRAIRAVEEREAAASLMVQMAAIERQHDGAIVRVSYAEI